MPKSIRQLKPIDYIAVLFILGIGAFTALSQHDWDWHYHRAVMEIDYRSWILDFKPPLWSYQFCAGISRIGDAEAFGLSPLFFIVLVFGSLWGSIFMFMGCASIGYVFMARTLEVIAQHTVKEGSFSWDLYTISRSFSLLMISSNFFLWHFKVGHITFVLYYLVFAIIFYSLDAWTNGLTRARFVGATLITWAFYSAGFYHALMFFLMPLFLALVCLVFFSIFFARARNTIKEKKQGVLSALAFHCLGILLGSYKISGIFAYQQKLPRVVQHIPERVDQIIDLFIEQLVPTYAEQYILGLNVKAPWGIWEHSTFSFVAWVLVAALIIDAAKRFASTKKILSAPHKTFYFFLFLAASTFLLFRLGDHFAGPYVWFNEHLLDHSLRVAGRYNFGLTCLIAIVAWVYLLQSQTARTFYLRMYPLLLILAFLNMMSFDLSLNHFSTALNLSGAHHDEMRHLRIISSKDDRTLAVLDGVGLPNCFSPLQRKKGIVPDVLLPRGAVTPSNKPLEFSFLDLKHPGVNEACYVESYFTQNDLVISSECPEDICVNFNDIAPAQKHRFFFNDERGLFCMKPKGKQ